MRTLATDFRRARDGYAITGSVMARKRLTRSLLAYLRAGGRMGFAVPKGEGKTA